MAGFIETGSATQKLMGGGFTDTQTAWILRALTFILAYIPYFVNMRKVG
jgi:hypothetical protein